MPPPPDEGARLQHARHTPRSLTALLAQWADRITVERGIRYANDGAASVEGADWLDETTLSLHGHVLGSSETPYATQVTLEPADEDWGEIVGECSCPVVYDCKHAVALVWTWAKSTGLISGERVTSESPAKPDTPPVIARKKFLAAPIDLWLQRTYANTEAPTKSKELRAPSAERLGFVLSTDGVLSALKIRAGRAGEIKRANTAASLAWIRHDHRTPAYVSEEDEPILRLMEGAQDKSQFAPQVRLIGQTGSQLLRMALGTGRLYSTPDSEDAPLAAPIVMGVAQHGALTWVQQMMPAKAKGGAPVEMVRLRFVAADGALCTLLATTPPIAFNPAQSMLAPIETALCAQTLERLLALPPIARSDETAWRFIIDAWSSFPDAAFIPQPPVELEPLPTPTGVLRFALVEVSVTQGWGKYAKESNAIVPAVEFTLQYADGRRVYPQPTDTAAPIEEELQGATVVRATLRNLRAERTWSMRLPTRLQPLMDVEPALRYAMSGSERISLYALQRHNWANDGPRVLADAQAAGFSLLIEPGFPLTLEDIPEPELELIPAAQNGWFRFALGVDVGGQRVDLAPAFARLIAAQRDPQAWLEALAEGDKILLTLEDGRVVRLDGGRVHAMLAPVLAWFQGGQVDQISVLQAALLPAQVIYRGRDTDAWAAMREKLSAGATLQPVSPAKGFVADLRPYQLSGLAWLTHLHELRMGAVLADDMGLGKTVQTLAHLHRLHIAGSSVAPSLIIAPTSVVSNWRTEAGRFAPQIRIHIHIGKERTLTKKEWSSTDVVITSYPILQRDAQTFAQLEWNTVIFDEAQSLKNPRAKTYQAAQGISAKQRIALTGTPMENHLGELWSLFNVLSPGLLGDLETFNRHFRHRIEQNSDTDRLNLLRARIRPFLLRRTRDEVVKELPEKTEAIRWIDLEPQQADLYESLRTAIHDDVRKAIDKKGLKQSTIHILDALLKLRQACCDPRLVKLPDGKSRADAPSAKLEWLMEHVPILIEEGRRILIFSQFTSMLAIIEKTLNDAGIETVILTGDTKDRDTPINQFQSGDVPVFLLSLKAGGVGLNLTAADTVIHYDPWWNPSVEAQATARAHRIGQDKPVFVYKLLARGTLEERMLALIERKQQLAEALLTGGSAALTGITGKDVEDLLSPIESIAALAERAQSSKPA